MKASRVLKSYPHGRTGTIREASFRVVGASKASTSVSDMVYAGHHVIISEVGGIDVSRAAHKGSGVPLAFVRRIRVNQVD